MNLSEVSSIKINCFSQTVSQTIFYKMSLGVLRRKASCGQISLGDAEWW